MMFRILDKVLDSLLFVILATMVAVSGANVFCRFILGFSLAWASEVALGLLVWLTFLGAAVAMREHSHYMFDYLRRSVSGTVRFSLVVSARLITCAALLALLYWSAQVTWGIREWVLPATQMSRAVVYVSCPLGCLLMLLYAGRDLRAHIREHRPDEDTETVVGETSVIES